MIYQTASHFSPKTPDDSLLYAFRFDDWLVRNALTGVQDFIIDADITASPDDLIITEITFTGTLVGFMASGGVAGVDYTVSCHASTSVGMVVRVEEILPVRNVAR